jgi:hypothetical protein
MGISGIRDDYVHIKDIYKNLKSAEHCLGESFG